MCVYVCARKRNFDGYQSRFRLSRRHKDNIFLLTVSGEDHCVLYIYICVCVCVSIVGHYDEGLAIFRVVSSILLCSITRLRFILPHSGPNTIFVSHSVITQAHAHVYTDQNLVRG